MFAVFKRKLSLQADLLGARRGYRVDFVLPHTCTSWSASAILLVFSTSRLITVFCYLSNDLRKVIIKILLSVISILATIIFIESTSVVNNIMAAKNIVLVR